MDRAVMSVIAESLGVLRVVWAAQIVALGVFGVVLFVAKPAPTAGPEMVWAMAVAAAIATPMLFLVRRQVLGGTLALWDPDDLRASQHLDGPELVSAVRVASGRYRVGTIVGMALAEAIALFGFTASWVSGDVRLYAAFAAYAAALMLLQVPRVAGLRAVLPAEARAGLDRALRT